MHGIPHFSRFAGRGRGCFFVTSVRKGSIMCRWLAYSGSPLLLESILYKPKHSLIDQSLHARLGPHTTNGDGF